MRVFRFKVLLLSFLLFVVNLSVSVRVNKGNSLNEPDRRSEHAEAKAQQNVNTAGDNKDTQKNNDKEGVSDTEDSQKDGQTLRSNSTAKPYGNDTLHPKTSAKPTTTTPPTPKPILPVQTGVKAQEEEQSSGMTIFFSLLVIGWWFCSINFISVFLFKSNATKKYVL